MDVRRTGVSLSQDKISFINSAFQGELDYWKKAALEGALELNDANELKDLPPPSLLLIRKAAKNAKKTGINGIIFYLTKITIFS